MVRITDICLGEGIDRGKLADSICKVTGLRRDTELMLMEKQSSNYIDYYYRADKTSDLVLIRVAPKDNTLVRVVYRKGFFEDKDEYVRRVRRIAVKYGISQERIFALSDSEEVVHEFLDRLKNFEKGNISAYHFNILTDGNSSVVKTRRALCELLGRALNQSLKIKSKPRKHIEMIAEWIIDYSYGG